MNDETPRSEVHPLCSLPVTDLTTGYSIAMPPPNIIINGADGTPLVTIHPDGALDYGPGYSPDKAARAFWDALRHLAPARCPNCGHTGQEQP